MTLDGPVFDDVVAGLDPVGLDEINADAALQTRVDRKYVVSAGQLADLVATFASGCSVLDIDGRRSFRYASVYHDTAERRLYLDTANRRPFRFKVRERSYVDAGNTMLEVKTKNGRGKTVKYRIDLEDLGVDVPARRTGDLLTDEMCGFVDEVVDTDITAALAPVLRVQFERTTLLTSNGDSRCTIDCGLTSSDFDGGVVRPDFVVVETKSLGHRSEVDRWLWSQGLRPARLSKYCTAMSMLDRSLPANHWHRTLRRHFSVQRPAA